MINAVDANPLRIGIASIPHASNVASNIGQFVEVRNNGSRKPYDFLNEEIIHISAQMLTIDPRCGSKLSDFSNCLIIQQGRWLRAGASIALPEGLFALASPQAGECTS